MRKTELMRKTEIIRKTMRAWMREIREDGWGKGEE